MSNQGKLYNLCECYNKQHKSTLKYNIPYSLARGEKKKIDMSRYPKGTYFVICPNGTNPLTYKRNGNKNIPLVEKANMGTNMGTILLPISSTGVRIPTNLTQEERYLEQLQKESKLDSPELIEELPEDF